jgi:hypothetical protein
MARIVKTLSATEKAKPGVTPKKMFDGGGLFLIVTPTGGKWWRFKFTFDGREKTISFGVYPDITLAQAREKREAARKLLAIGVNPSEDRRAAKAARVELLANSF